MEFRPDVGEISTPLWTARIGPLAYRQVTQEPERRAAEETRGSSKTRLPLMEGGRGPTAAQVDRWRRSPATDASGCRCAHEVGESFNDVVKAATESEVKRGIRLQGHPLRPLVWGLPRR